MFTTFKFNNTADYTTCLQHLSLITLQIIPHVYNIKFNNTADYATCLQHLSLITLHIIPHVYNI